MRRATPLGTAVLTSIFLVLAVATKLPNIGAQANIVQQLRSIQTTELKQTLVASGTEIGDPPEIKGVRFNNDARGAQHGMLAVGRAVSTLKSRRVDQPNVTTLRSPVAIDVYKATVNGTVLVASGDGFGSGALISADGKILTNWHVVVNSPKVSVVFKPDGEREPREDDVLSATVLAVDKVADLALIQVSNVPQHAKAVQLGALETVRVGQDVYAIGHPEGYIWTYTMGIVSAIRPDFEWDSGMPEQHKATIVQTQTALNPGSSGGPLFDEYRLLIGLNSIKASGEGLNFAVSVRDIRSFLERVQRGDTRISDIWLQPQSSPRVIGYWDQNQNGIVDTYGYDETGDSLADFWAVDANENKVFDYGTDYLAFDENKNGWFEAIVTDSNGDGLYDFWAFDVNGDNKFDYYATDVNGDGVFEKYWPIG